MTLQAVLNQDLTLWQTVTNTFPSDLFPIKSPMPGDNSNFQQYRIDENKDGTNDIPDNASFSDANARFAWFKDDMLPAWETWRQGHATIDLQTLFEGGYKP